MKTWSITSHNCINRYFPWQQILSSNLSKTQPIRAAQISQHATTATMKRKNHFKNANSNTVAQGYPDCLSVTMERTALLRSLSCSSLACNRYYFRSSHKLSQSLFSRPSSSLSAARRNQLRLIPNLTGRSLHRCHIRLRPPLSSSLHFNKRFSTLSVRAVASPPAQPSPGTKCLLFETTISIIS